MTLGRTSTAVGDRTPETQTGVPAGIGSSARAARLWVPIRISPKPPSGMSVMTRASAPSRRNEESNPADLPGSKTPAGLRFLRLRESGRHSPCRPARRVLQVQFYQFESAGQPASGLQEKRLREATATRLPWPVSTSEVRHGEPANSNHKSAHSQCRRITEVNCHGSAPRTARVMPLPSGLRAYRTSPSPTHLLQASR